MKKIVTIAMLCFLAASSIDLLAAEPQGKGATPEISNIGFMKDPPKELTDRFPMCDVFLNVQWLNKPELLGYVHFEAIVKLKSGKTERKDVWSIVDLSVVPDFAAGDLYQYKRTGQLEHVLNMVRKGTWRKTIRFHPLSLANDDDHGPLLSDHRQTVCVAYPDGQRAWIAEGRNVKQTFSKEQTDDLLQRINESIGREFPRKRLENLWLLDINFDGKSDFIEDRSFLYFVSERLYQVQNTYDVIQGFKLVFPPDNQSCRLPETAGFQIMTDGKSYFFTATDFKTGIKNIRCDLTEMTTTSGAK